MQKNKKILLINTYFSPVGGAEVIAYNTYKLLKDNGYDVYFWGCDKKPFFEDSYEYTKYFTKFDDSIKNYKSWYYNTEAKKDLAKFIDLIKPDLIHLHSFVTYLSPSVLECCKDIPTVATLHNTDLVCPAVKLLYKNKKPCNKVYCKNGKYIQCLLNNCTQNIESAFRKTIRAYITNVRLNNIDYFITPSKALMDLMINNNEYINENNIATVNNFLSENEFDYSEPDYTSKGYFLYIGRLSREKGVHYLLEALKDLPRDIQLHIIGGGNEEESLKQYAKENKLDNVKFLGFKNRKEIKEEYQNCIATILPCNWFENFPTTNMESFINGKPVIASNIGGIPEQVEHNKTGLLFEPANINQLKECVLKYWQNSDLVREHGENAYKKAGTNYSQKQYFNSLISIYNKFLKEN